MIIKDEKFLEICGLSNETKQAIIALNFRRSLSEYGKIEEFSIDPRKSHGELMIVIPDDSIDIVDFTIIFMQQYDVEICEYEFANIFKKHNRSDSILKDLVVDIVAVVIQNENKNTDIPQP